MFNKSLKMAEGSNRIISAVGQEVNLAPISQGVEMNKPALVKVNRNSRRGR